MAAITRRTHRPVRHRMVRSACQILTGVVVVGGAATSAGAHTEVLRSSPSPAEEVAAPVEEIEVTFLDPVLPSVTVDVTDSTGDQIAAGDVELSDDGRVATQRLPDLEEAGDYVVGYTYTAEDGDTQRGTYQFTVVADDGDDATSAGALVGLAAVIAVVVAGVVVALLRRRRAS